MGIALARALIVCALAALLTYVVRRARAENKQRRIRASVDRIHAAYLRTRH